MTLIAGIDEAGLGPVLGPLVVSATAFAVPDADADRSMWRLLSGAVTQRPSRRAGVVAVADSKRLYSRKRKNALAHLERGVLAALATRGARPDSLGRLLALVAPGAADDLPAYPWYAGADLPLPHAVSATDVRLAGNALAVAMDRAGVSPLAARSEVLCAGRFNRIVRATQNKSTTLFDVTCRLLMHLWRNLPAGALRIVVDRQGGRVRYLPALQRAFAGGRFRVIDESDGRSAYAVTYAGRGGEVCFTVGAEGKHLPVALASMLSKYLRELFMDLFNRFWADRVPGIAATAGYYTDGRRFYREIAPAVRALGVDADLIYRSR